MKKIIAIIAVAIVALFSANSVNAQSKACQDVNSLSLRPYVGYSFSVLTNSELDTEVEPGFTLGVDAQYMFTKSFGVSVGGEYTFGDWKYKEGDMKGSIAYVNQIGAPILADVYLFKGFAVKGGVKPTYIFGEGMTKDKNDKEHSFTGKYELNKFDVDVVLGVSYEFKNMVFELRENVGPTKIFKNDDRKTNKASYLGNLSLSFGYRF